MVRYAEYLKEKNVKYSILCAFEQSWIESNARAKQLEFINWPLKNDSLIYFPDKIPEVRSFLESKLESDDSIHLFTFCMRDYVNAVLLFKESRLKINLFQKKLKLKFLKGYLIMKNKIQEYTEVLLMVTLIKL